MDNQIPVTYSNHKPILILIFLGILIILLSIAGFLYFKKQSIPLLTSNTIDLTKGKVTDLKDNLGFYIEQSPEVCSQNNLNKAFFKSFVLPDKSGEATTSGARSVYGETTWNYILQGEISNIQSVTSGIKYTLTSGENTLITQTTNNTVSWLKNSEATTSSYLVPTKINASTFSLKDKVYLYYLVKCGGNRPPLLFLEYIQKAGSTQKTQTTTPKHSDKTASIPLGLRNAGNNLSGFTGKVKDKGTNYLILEGGGQTMKVEIPNNLEILIISNSEFIKNPDLYMKQPPQYISLSNIKKGDNIDAVGKYDGKLFNAVLVTITQ